MPLQQMMRWYGPDDPVSLRDIRQAGCTGVVTALHQIPVGEVWPIDEITERKLQVEAAGMVWTVVESLPVSEQIKRQTGNYLQHINNYKESLANLTSQGLKVITYNFMPLLDWIRTDISFELPDKSKALYFNRLDFIVFDLFLLKRPYAEINYAAREIDEARRKHASMSADEKQKIFKNVLLGLPGSRIPFTSLQVLKALQEYADIDDEKLRSHLFYFLKEIAPAAQSLGLQMAIHPDDPPYSLLGLPRIVSTAADIRRIINAESSNANGLCFCTGALGAREDNDIINMIKEFGSRIHFLHLRNTKRDDAGNFFEADHLDGDTDMFAVMTEVVKLMKVEERSIPMRPDHGHEMLDDLGKDTFPGYSAIGRLKGLAELRGLELGVTRSMNNGNG